MARLLAWILAAVSVCAVVACSRPEPGPPVSIAATSYRGLPSDAPTSPTLPGGASAIWRGATIELTLWGSSSCPAVPVALAVRDPATIEVTVDVGRQRRRACTTDISAITSVLVLPDGLRPAAVLTVWLVGFDRPLKLEAPSVPAR
jgi:hypothetical protein